MGSYANLEDALRAVLRNYLEARLVLCEIRRASLNFELDSPKPGSPEERAKITAQRDAALVEWGELESLKTVATLELLESASQS